MSDPDGVPPRGSSWRYVHGGPSVEGRRPMERYSFEPPMLFQLKYTRSTRTMSPVGTRAVVPSMFKVFGWPLKTWTPVESPNTLYMLRRAVTLTLSATCASNLRRRRLV